MPIQPETLPWRRPCAAGPERMSVHIVTPEGLRRMLLEGTVNTGSSVRNNGYPAL